MSEQQPTPPDDRLAKALAESIRLHIEGMGMRVAAEDLDAMTAIAEDAALILSTRQIGAETEPALAEHVAHLRAQIDRMASIGAARVRLVVSQVLEDVLFSALHFLRAALRG